MDRALLAACIFMLPAVLTTTVADGPSRAVQPDANPSAPQLRKGSRVLVTGGAGSNNLASIHAPSAEENVHALAQAPLPPSQVSNSTSSTLGNWSIFVWDHTNLDLGNASAPYRALFNNDSLPPSMLQEDHDFAEFEIARDAKRVLEIKMPGNLAASADEADVVFVALWPYGLCMVNASGETRGMADWQVEKGILAAGTCPELRNAYTQIVQSDRFKVTDGRDFAFIADKVTKMLEGLNPGNAYQSIVQRSVLVGVEERRISSNVGASRHLPVPYYVDPPTWYLETDDTPPLSKEVFIAYWGSRHVGEHCPACESKEFDPSTVRDGVIDQLERACKFRGRLSRKECRIYVNDDRGGRNSLLHASRDLKFEEIMQKSLFCPVPRGDSAATKRFYCAVAALCIPVVVSDHFPFPFSERVDYDSFVVRIRERDIADGAVDVYQMLANMDPHRIAQRQRAMEVARRDILYTRESYQAPMCDLPACQKAAWHKGRAVMNLMYALRNLPACHKEKATALEGCDQQIVGSSWHQPVTDWAEIGAGQNRVVAERRSPEAAELAPGTGAGNSRLDVGNGSSCVSIAPDASDWWCATTCGFGGDMAACPPSMCKCDAAANEQASKDNETAVTPAEAYIAATPQKGRG